MDKISFATEWSRSAAPNGYRLRIFVCMRFFTPSVNRELLDAIIHTPSKKIFFARSSL
jgi:hypothetical protein